MTDVELDARVTALEEGGGGNGDGVNGKRYDISLVFCSWMLSKTRSAGS